MFEAADLEHGVSKAAYKRQEPKLRRELLDAQYDSHENGRFPVLSLIAGVAWATTTAVCGMVDTSTRIAPWTLVKANNKYYARIKVLKAICEKLIKARYPP